MTGPDMCFRRMAEVSMRKKGWRQEGQGGGFALLDGKRVTDGGQRGVERSGKGGRILIELGQGGVWVPP